MSQHETKAKVALVTGAARRIGAEISRTLHAIGMNLVLHYNHSDEEANKLCDELNQIRPQSAIALRTDLAETDCEKSLISRAIKAFGRLDALVNNASRFYRTAVGEATQFSWDDLMTSNLRAPFFLAQAAIPYLKETNGCIINITDIHAEVPLRDYSIYCMSKSALLMMTRVLARELGPHVRVNAVAPGPIIWPEGDNELNDEEKKKIVDSTALKRAGSPQDIAKAVLFFVCDADYVTGQVLNVDGGRLVR